MVFPLPSFPWQEAQFCAHVALASAATLTPADTMTTIARTNICRFITLVVLPMPDPTSTIQQIENGFIS
jgi:hypothetical protein